MPKRMGRRRDRGRRKRREKERERKRGRRRTAKRVKHFVAHQKRHANEPAANTEMMRTHPVERFNALLEVNGQTREMERGGAPCAAVQRAPVPAKLTEGLILWD